MNNIFISFKNNTKPLPAKAGRFDEVTDLKSVLSKSACSACKWFLFTVWKTVDLDQSGNIKKIGAKINVL